jgi:hypothetical protein
MGEIVVVAKIHEHWQICLSSISVEEITRSNYNWVKLGDGKLNCNVFFFDIVPMLLPV